MTTGARLGRGGPRGASLVVGIAALLAANGGSAPWEPTPPSVAPPVTEVAAEVQVGNGPCCLAATEQGVWVLNRRDGTLQLVDPKVTKPVEVGAVEMGLVGDHLFVADTDAGILSLFDPATRRQRVIQGFESRGGHAFHDGTLWLGSTTDGTLARLRPPSTKVLGTITIWDVENYVGMALADDATLWTTTWDGELLKSTWTPRGWSHGCGPSRTRPTTLRSLS